MIKLYIANKAVHGIKRVIEAEYKHLKRFGVEPTNNIKEADVIQNHGTEQYWESGKPILHTSHGLYWSRQDWGDGYQEVNEMVVDSMSMAQAHTAPSEWVSRALRRGGLWYPEVVYHGIDAKEFEPDTNENYVLWNKGRPDWVSDPRDMNMVASMLPGVKFKSTFGKVARNVEILIDDPNKGIAFDEMKKLVSHAGVYLCTARETFGIGTLEAMACGVPVAGWNWGGQSEIILQGVTGYLAPPGDYKALAECIKLCFEERERLGSNARDDIFKRWTWGPRIEQYANIVKRLYHDYYELKRPRVSIILTTHNLDKYLPKCLESVRAQTITDFECLVVDDAQQDSTRMITQDFIRRDRRIRYLPTPHNLGLPGARNFGFNHAKGRYIRHLDADDYLAESALELESQALDQNPKIHIVYGHLETVREDGSRIVDKGGNPLRSGWPGNDYNWYAQMAHLNQLPSCSMMRREVLLASGGYRDRMKRAEDAEFWCRVTSLGFRAAKITQAVTYFHRQREDSKGSLEWKHEGKEPDWTSWFPWRMGAGDYDEGNKIIRKLGNRHPNPHMVPFGSQGKAIDTRFWYVHDYAYPIVSVIVTCGPYHEKHLLDALDSVQAQTYPDWECIVVNDTGKSWDSDIQGAPFAKVVNMDGNQGTSRARNEGFKHARGKYIVWLDADDIWLPWFLERMVAYAEVNDGVIYCDLIQDNDQLKVYRYIDFESENVPKHMMYPGSSVLYPRSVVETIFQKQGGYDTEIAGMEDWDFQIATHDLGFCAYHIQEALFIYRIYSSTKRERDHAKIKDIVAYVDEKWKEYRTGAKIMGCGCKKPKVVNTKPVSTLQSSGNFSNAQTFVKEESPEQLVDVEYLGSNEGKFSVRSKVYPGKSYKFSRSYNTQTVFMKDAEYLVSQVDHKNMPLYRIVPQGATVENRDPQAVLGRALSG